MSKLSIASDDTIFSYKILNTVSPRDTITCEDPDFDNRPTIPMDLAPKSEETYDDIGAFEMEKDFSHAFATVRIGLEEEDDCHDRPTLNFSHSAEDAA